LRPNRGGKVGAGGGSHDGRVTSQVSGLTDVLGLLVGAAITYAVMVGSG
jgi:hypothetical protein